MTVPDDISDKEIERFVVKLFDAQDEDFNFRRLQLVGRKAIPALIAALDDPRTSNITFAADPRGLRSTDSPFERICELLEPFGPPEAAVRIERFMESKHVSFRQAAAMALANIGTSACLDSVNNALADPLLRSHVLMGLRNSGSEGRCEIAFVESIFPVVARFLTRETFADSEGVLEALLALDGNRATALILSSDLFSPDFDEFRRVVKVLNESGQKIPHENLLPLLRKLEPLSNEYPHDREYAETLVAYACNPDSEAKTVLRTALQSTNETVQESAAKSLAILAGVVDPVGLVLYLRRAHGYDSLTEPQQRIYAAFGYAAEVRNGGHTQYFSNSTGNEWKTAMAALTAMSAHKRVAILQEAVALFGPDGPSEDGELRGRQLATLIRKDGNAFDSFDNRFYACDENIDAMLFIYAIDHKQDFVRDRAKP